MTTNKKILGLWMFGSNEIQNLMPHVYPGSKSLNFYNTYNAEGEDATFKRAYELLEEKPDIIMLYQFYNRKGSPEKHKVFLDKAQKTSRVFYHIHDTPTDIESFDMGWWGRFERIFVPNFDRVKRMRKMGMNAEFLPPGCSRRHFIDRTPHPEKAKIDRRIYFVVAWLKIETNVGDLSARMDRKVYLKQLLDAQIHVVVYGPEGVYSRIDEIESDKSSIEAHDKIDYYRFCELAHAAVFFNGVLYSGELSLNRRFANVLAIGGVQMYHNCRCFNDYCEAFFGEIPSESETPFILYDDPDDFVRKTKSILHEPDNQLLSRRKKSSEYRTKWSFEKVIKVMAGDEPNPSLKML